MPRPLLAVLLAAALLAGPLAAAGGSDVADGSALRQGREAYARKDYRAAVPLLEGAVQALDRGRDRAVLAEVYLELGLSYLVGTAEPEKALAAFTAAAELTDNPTNALLLAATAAERLGRLDQVDALRRRALASPAPPPASPPAAAAPQPPPPPPPPAPQKPEEPAAKPSFNAAFEHFFGTKIPPPPPPAPAPAVAAQVPAAPAPAAPAPAPGKTTAFDHFFGKKSPPAPAPPAAAAKAPGPPGSPSPPSPAPPPAGEKPPEKPQKPTGSAFDHFFKKKPPEDKPADPPANPPGSAG